MTEELNITELIENNPITKLSNTYNNKFLIKIKEKFSNYEQQLFISSFYCYLHYDKNKDFIIDLDNIWKWLEFSSKQKCLSLLEKFFVINTDYILSVNLQDKQENTDINVAEKTKENDEPKKWGGQNIKKYYLTISCFKCLCLKAQTKKASDIHNYYIHLEDILHETLEEETTDLKNQLKIKDNLLFQSEEEKLLLRKEKEKGIEKAIISQFPVNTECIYLGKIENTNDEKETLIKFGQTNNLGTRICEHRKTFNNFILIHAFKVQNKVEIENLIKNDKEIKKQIRSIYINGKISVELIAYNEEFTIEKLINRIKTIIQSKTYSIENFNTLLQRNEELENHNAKCKDYIKKLQQDIDDLNSKFEKSQVEVIYLKEKLEEKNKEIEQIYLHNNINITINKNSTLIKNNNKNQNTNQNPIINYNLLLPESDNNTFRFNQFIDECCILSSEEKELSTNIEGRFRIWNQQKPTKEIFHALKQYMDNRFKQDRVKGAHRGYLGISLKPMEYKKIKLNSDAENFIFQECTFSDSGKILNSVLLYEYQNWKKTVGKEIHGEEMNELKEYLNECPYAIKSVVWTEYGSNEGYYGLSPKKNETQNYKKVVNGKSVYKRKTETNELLGKWASIATAAEMENISTSKMSRYVKNGTIIDSDYYYATE